MDLALLEDVQDSDASLSLSSCIHRSEYISSGGYPSQLRVTITTPLGPSSSQLESPRLDREWDILSHLRKALLSPEVLLEAASFYFRLQAGKRSLPEHSK